MKQITARLEELRNEYPPIPTEISELIQREVALRTNAIFPIKDRKADKQARGFSWKKAAALVLGAIMVFGATVFAGGAIGRLRIQQEGNYALQVGVTPAADASNPDAPTVTPAADISNPDALTVIPAQIPCLSLKAGYIPEGYRSGEDTEAWNVYPKETPFQNGLTAAISVLGEEITEEGFPLIIDYVLYSEEIPWQDRTALYVELQKPYWDAPMKRIYIPLPEYWQGLIVYGGKDISKDEMVIYAENLEVIREEGTYASTGRLGWVEHSAESEPSLDYGTRKVPCDRFLKNLHPVGETFPLRNTIRTVSAGAELSAVVKKVEIFDDFSPLDSRCLDEAVLELLDEDHKLRSNLIRYMSEGNGISSISSEVCTQTVAQKLVYVTVEYINISDRDLQNITDHAVLCRMIEKDGSFMLYDRALEDGDLNTDYILENDILGHSRMIYCDACAGGHLREHCAVPEIKAGESITIHIAGVVNEDELDKLYLNLGGGENVISEWTLAAGYVDLRQ